jgi:hypothetical protein
MLHPMLGACFAAMLVPKLLRNEPIYDSLRERRPSPERALTVMVDAFDSFAFAVFGMPLVAAAVVVGTLGSLPGQIAHGRGHAQATAITVASWLGIATGGLL